MWAMFNQAVEHLPSNTMNTFERRGGHKSERMNLLKWQLEGKSSYCVEPGMILTEEGERDCEGGEVIKASFSLYTGAPAGWLSDAELCPLACRKLAKLFTPVYAH